jgi:hypothetical protein
MKTPMAVTPTMSDIEQNEKIFPYREAVGSLLYMTSKTRPDMPFTVNEESRCTQENPYKIAVYIVKRTFRYVKGTKHIGITN